MKSTTRKNKTRKNKTRKIGGAKKITNDEIKKCDTFCSKYYLEKHKKWIRNVYKKNPYLAKKTDSEIDKIIKNLDKEEIVRDCKSVFCAPNCPSNGKGYPIRYACPACKKQFGKIKEKGAVTYCRHNDII